MFPIKVAQELGRRAETRSQLDPTVGLNLLTCSN